ncbi:MAG: sel1 repeat family protein, partial [Clostridia bacterium]|nr:sel1 repeat family protein [Clostridia bacterium]
QNGLGYCYQYGLGVQQDDAMAVKYYRLSADQGNATAQFNLCWCYECGYGVSKDLNEAIHLYRLAAKGGSNDAKKALARLGVSE